MVIVVVVLSEAVVVKVLALVVVIRGRCCGSSSSIIGQHSLLYGEDGQGFLGMGPDLPHPACGCIPGSQVWYPVLPAWPPCWPQQWQPQAAVPTAGSLRGLSLKSAHSYGR